MSGSRSGALYRALLRLLPWELRERHASDMEALFLVSLAEARRRSALAWTVTWVSGAWDVVRRSVYEHSRGIRHRNSGGSLVSTMLNDLRFALRGFIRQPGITFLVVLMLALGIAATTAVFSLVNGLFLRPLPFPDAERLVYLNETAPQWDLEETGISYADFVVWRENAREFQAMGLFTPESFNVAAGDGADRIDGMSVTYDFASAIGIRPVLGRTFTPEEDRPNAPPVVMIGNGLWQRRFGGSPGVLGQTLRINGVPHAVVGVLPPEAEFPGGVELWLPMRLDPVETEGSYSYEGIGRLRQGVTVEQARADLFRAHQPVWEDRDTDRVVSPRVMALGERLAGDFELVAIALAAAVALVLLIACANVASILLARSFARRRELGIRMALGAGAARLARQLFTESLALSLVAGPLGLLLGFWSIRLLLRSLPDQLPAWMELTVDWRMALFGLGVVVATSVLFGWAPMLQTRGEDVRGALAEGGGRAGASRAQRRTMSALVVGEVTLAALLLIGGGLLLRAFDRLRDVDPGFRTENVLSFRLELPEATYPDSAAQYGFYRDLLGRINALPGVRATGAVTCPPLGCHWGGFFEAEGAPPRGPDAANPVVLYRFATAGYFEAMGIRLERGRYFGEAGEGAEAVPTVVINEIFARQFFPDASDPLGRRIHFAGDTTDLWFTIVGVTQDVMHYGLDEPMRPGVYFPLEPQPQSGLTVAVWTSVPLTTLVDPIREVVRDMDPELPVYQLGTTGEALENSLAVQRAYSRLIAIFAGMALVLALGGIYGVLSYVVGQRTREIGIRVALGATRSRVLWMVVRQGMVLIVTGLVLGLVAALATGQLLEGLLFGVSARDPATFVAVALLLSATAFLATLVPARRALGVDPQVVLREE